MTCHSFTDPRRTTQKIFSSEAQVTHSGQIVEINQLDGDNPDETDPSEGGSRCPTTYIKPSFQLGGDSESDSNSSCSSKPPESSGQKDFMLYNLDYFQCHWDSGNFQVQPASSSHEPNTSNFSANSISTMAPISSTMMPELLNSKHVTGKCASSPILLNPNSPPFLHDSFHIAPNNLTRHSSFDWVNAACQQVIRDMDIFGVCVIDGFLGEAGDSVLKEVELMYKTGKFIGGQVVSQSKTSKNIRGDQITWVSGNEKSCQMIGFLVKQIDSIIHRCNRSTNNGKFGDYSIKGRTKAMVACYPGSGTHYVKHVDNPNKDGRCITAIYYLNKNWNVKEHGGLLRIFPSVWTNQVADIEPKFDRVIFFWSDRRNPHEVQPAYRTRFAITVWYLDDMERKKAKSIDESSKYLDTS